MEGMTSPSRSTAQHANDAATAAARSIVEPAAPWIERFARVGFAAKAVLYGIVGALALRAATSAGGQATGRDGAFSTLVRQEWGPIVLVVMALGLFGYAAWRIAEAILDPERKGRDAKGIALRVSYAARGLFHAALGVQAVRLASGMGGSNDQNAESLTARALDAPMGPWLVIGAGLAFVGYGLYQLYRAWKAKLSRQLDLSRLSQEAGAGVIKVCRLGIGARGVVFAVIGGFLIRAGLDRNANRAADTGEALSAIGRQPFGPWLLALVAVGLIAYAVYEVVQARYRVIRPA
jgi:hypothetical protein